MDYKAAGVDIDAGTETVRRIRVLARSTFTSGVLSDIGSFGGLFRLETGRFQDPVLVSSADGVGTKLKVAFLAGRHDTVGIDLVNHCDNDILVQGAEPLFFLDYLATGHLAPDVAESIVSGMARACRENSCALLGGETAEMPGMYAEGEYDLAGFAVGAVEKAAIIDGRTIAPGDVVLGLASSGPHSNGFSLIRRIVDEARADLRAPLHGTTMTIGEALLAPTRIYVKPLLSLMRELRIKGMAHITGGGLVENVPRILPPRVEARLDANSWPRPAIFNWLQQQGRVADAEMHRVFNCGIGMAVIVAAGDADRAQAFLER